MVSARRLCYVLLLTIVHLSVTQAFCPSMCQCNDRLLETSCVSSKLDTVPILLNPALRTLRLSHNRVSSLRQSFAFYTEMRWLDLSHNALHSLGSRHFESLQSLQHLNVSANLISSLESDAFTGLVSVTVLDLSGNRLTLLPPGLFSEMNQLQTLILTGNKIQTVSQQAFDSLRHLHTLRLDDNNIQHVPSAALAAASANLRSLHLSKNLIETLDDLAFDKLVKLRSLHLNDNAIRHMDPMALHGLASLDVLDLSFNRLDYAPLKALSSPSLGQVKHLDLSGNMWRELPAGLLHGLPSLVSLNVSYMEYLRHVDTDALSGNGNNNSTLLLTNLVMTNNALWNRLPAHLLDHLPHLQRLDLSGNAFETVDKPQRLEQWNLQYLSVAYNPLECNCSLTWLWQLLRHSNSSLVVVNVTCSRPDLLSGLQLSTLADQELMCPSSLPASIIALLVVGWLLLVVLLVCLLVYCRWKKRTLLKSSRGAGSYGHGTSPILTKNGSPNTSHHHHPTHNHPHHHYYSAAMVADADEYTYHCAGSIKRIPVTVV